MDSPGLKPEEKADGWKRIRSHMESHPLSAAEGAVTANDEAFAVSFFHAASEVSLTEPEHNAAYASVSEHKDLAAFFAPAQQVSLGTLERASILSGIVGGHVPHASPVHEAAPIKMTFFRWMVPALGIVFLAGAGGIGISYAAEDALPGEFLYSIKRASEQLEASFRFSAEARANADAKRMERRMQEAKKLRETAKLTDSVSTTLDQEFRLERREANQHIQELEENGKEQAAAILRARLNATEDAYKRYVQRSDDSSSSAPAKNYPTLVEPVITEVVRKAEVAGGSAMSAYASAATTVKVSDDGSRLESRSRIEVRSTHDTNVESNTAQEATDAEMEAAKAAADAQVKDALEKANHLGADIQAQVQEQLAR